MPLSLWFLKVVLFLVIAVVVTPRADAAVVLSEILADPARDWNGDSVLSSRDDEWVEVANSGSETVDLSEYFIRDALGPEPQVRLRGVLAPGEVKVVYGSDAAAWQLSMGLAVSGLSWNNTGDPIFRIAGGYRSRVPRPKARIST